MDQIQIDRLVNLINPVDIDEGGNNLQHRISEILSLEDEEEMTRALTGGYTHIPVEAAATIIANLPSELLVPWATRNCHTFQGLKIKHHLMFNYSDQPIYGDPSGPTLHEVLLEKPSFEFLGVGSQVRLDGGFHWKVILDKKRPLHLRKKALVLLGTLSWCDSLEFLERVEKELISESELYQLTLQQISKVRKTKHEFPSSAPSDADPWKGVTSIGDWGDHGMDISRGD